nr:uncharacterized protein LOC113826256 isoform X2 [Penaeus vannamei]
MPQNPVLVLQDQLFTDTKLDMSTLQENIFQARNDDLDDSDNSDAARCTTDVTRLQTERSVRGRGWGLPSQDTPGDGMDNACTAAREQHVKWRRALVTDRRLNALPAILGILSTSGIPSGTSLPDLVTGALLCTYRKDSHPERNL